MSTVTMSVDCGKDETKVSILGSDGRIVHDRFKTRMEKVTALNSNAVQQEGVNKVSFEGTTYLIGSESDEVSLSNSKEELIHKIVTMTAIARHVENDDTVNVAIGCPISEYRNDEKRKSYRDYILPAEGCRVEIFIDGKKKYFTIGKRAVLSECIGTLFMYPEKYREGLTGIIDIGGLNVNGSFFTHGHIDIDRCFTIKCGKNIVVNALMQQFEEVFDGVFTRRDTEVFLNNGKVQGYEEESIKIIDDALNEQLLAIRNTCNRNKWNLNTCDLIFIGGTTNLLKDRIKTVFGDKIYIAKDAGFANADGYLSLFSSTLEKKG